MKNIEFRLFANRIMQITLMTVFMFLAFASDAHAAIPNLGGFIDNMLATISGAIGSVLATAATAFGAILGAVGTVLASVGLGPLWTVLMTWAFGAGACGQATMPGGSGIGQVICNVTLSAQNMPGFIAGISYLIGLVCAVSALIKLKDHVLNPNQTPLSDSMKRFLAGGAFFALPIVQNSVRNLVTGQNANTVASYGTTGNLALDTSGGYGLDTMLVALVADIIQPMMNLLTAFCYIGGLIFIVIGISRILKTAQEGPRGPTGLGTIGTFLTAGILLSAGPMMGAFSTSLFGDNTIEIRGFLSQTTGDNAVDAHAEAVIGAVISFMFIVGWVSFIRGFFILRDVSEGNNQASLMGAMTHIFGGALAVNLGPVMNAVQSTLGLTGFGVAFN